MQERKDKAQKLALAFEAATADKHNLDEALQYIASAYKIGSVLQHKKYGAGTIKDNQGGTIVVKFPEVGEKQLDLMTVAANGIVSVDIDGYENAMARHSESLKQRNQIETRLSIAEKDFAQYAPYL